jgi:DNA replication protein DnaC
MTPDFGPIDPDLLERIRNTRGRQFIDRDFDEPDIPQSPAWWHTQNRAYADTRIPRRYAHATTDRADVHQWVLTALETPDTAPSLLLAGPTGTGKTHTAYAALRLYTESLRPANWHATSTAAMLGDLRPAPGRDTEAVLAEYRTAPLLLLDDLGAAKSSEWVEETLYRLIDDRYNNCLPSIFATNVPTSDALIERLGDRTASRLVEMCHGHLITLRGADLRRARAAA